MAENQNGVVVEEEQSFNNENKKKKTTTENIYDVVHSLISEPSYTATRIKTSLSPFIPEASRNYSRRLLLWSRQGSPLRPLLLISVTLFLSFLFQFNLVQHKHYLLLYFSCSTLHFNSLIFSLN